MSNFVEKFLAMRNLNDPEVARPGVSVAYMLLTVAFVVCLIISNITEIKTIDIGYFTITAGVVVFPISYMINDCVTEIYGYARARLMIYTGFAMNLFVAFMLNVALWLPGGADWHHQEAMELIFSSVPRIMAASFTAFLFGSLMNAKVMSVMKIKAESRNRAMTRRSFSLRAIVSTVLGEGTDSIIFFPLAFGGTLPVDTIVSLIITQTLLKTLYEVVALPVTIAVVQWLRRIEGVALNDGGVLSVRSWTKKRRI